MHRKAIGEQFTLAAATFFLSRTMVANVGAGLPRDPPEIQLRGINPLLHGPVNAPRLALFQNEIGQIRRTRGTCSAFANTQDQFVAQIGGGKRDFRPLAFALSRSGARME